ncbi:hypothetical protein CDIK_1785 [Cucumispora dikerogammari]|nr:hypothetical protein CDIK_1785 [Cucumispora dikerogammari]
MKEQEPLIHLKELEEFYNMASSTYKFYFKCDSFQVNSKEELLIKHFEQKQIIINLQCTIKKMCKQKEKIILLKNNIESKLKKVVALKRHIVSNCEGVTFTDIKINERSSLILNKKYVSVLKDIANLLIELKTRALKTKK